MSASEKSVKKTVRPRILIIDDDPSFLTSMRLVLEQDYEVTEAQSIAQSLAAFDEQAPDLITLDIRMPGIDGMQGLDMFRHRSDMIPIILISGYHTFELAQQALRFGATDYLIKPFKIQELHQAVKTALAKACHDENSGLNLIDSNADFMVRLPLENLKEDKFLSLRHRNHFLTFAQNVLSNKKPAFEKIAAYELIKTIDLQFQALRLVENVACEIAHSDRTAQIECDMYLLGGALANLALTCMMATRSDKSPITLVFDDSGKELRLLYKKSDRQLPEDLRTRYERWHQHRNSSLDADTTMLALAEKVVQLHQGQFILNASSGSLLKITLPLN